MTLIYSSPFKLNIGVYDFPHKLISLVNPYIYFTVLRDDCVVSFKHNPLLLVTLRAVLETREIRLALVFRYNLKGFFAGQVNSPNNKYSTSLSEAHYIEKFSSFKTCIMSLKLSSKRQEMNYFFPWKINQALVFFQT